LVLAGAWLSWRQSGLLFPPRLAITSHHLLVFLRGFVPWRVPLDVVECFFIGQAPGPVPIARRATEQVHQKTVVVRLAERATAWHQRAVNSALGHWADGYITVHGTWCEPLSGELVRRMNLRLQECKRADK
jgi:hypothetical protein